MCCSMTFYCFRSWPVDFRRNEEQSERNSNDLSWRRIEEGGTRPLWWEQLSVDGPLEGSTASGFEFDCCFAAWFSFMSQGDFRFFSSTQGDFGSDSPLEASSHGDFPPKASSQGDFVLFGSPQGDVGFDDSIFRARISLHGGCSAFDLGFATSSLGDFFDFLASAVITQFCFLLPFQIFPFFAMLFVISFFARPSAVSVVFADKARWTLPWTEAPKSFETALRIMISTGNFALRSDLNEANLANEIQRWFSLKGSLRWWDFPENLSAFIMRTLVSVVEVIFVGRELVARLGEQWECQALDVMLPEHAAKRTNNIIWM